MKQDVLLFCLNFWFFVNMNRFMVVGYNLHFILIQIGDFNRKPFPLSHIRFGNIVSLTWWCTFFPTYHVIMYCFCLSWNVEMFTSGEQKVCRNQFVRNSHSPVHTLPLEKQMRRHGEDRGLDLYWGHLGMKCPKIEWKQNMQGDEWKEDWAFDLLVLLSQNTYLGEDACVWNMYI